MNTNALWLWTFLKEWCVYITHIYIIYYSSFIKSYYKMELQIFVYNMYKSVGSVLGKFEVALLLRIRSLIYNL